MLPGEAVAGAPVGIGRDVDVVLGGRASLTLMRIASHPCEADAVVSLGRDVLVEISG